MSRGRCNGECARLVADDIRAKDETELKEIGKTILGFFKTSPEKQARTFNKDVLEIIDMAETTYRDELNQQIAALALGRIEQIGQHCGTDSACQKHEIERHKILHREARRKNSQVSLTAYTLVIIHTRSLALAELGAPARQAIEEFCQRWPSSEAQSQQSDDVKVLAG